ncbi:MAG: hypothetical protein AAGD04_04820 [Pseudomonadota bacterium]
MVHFTLPEAARLALASYKPNRFPDLKAQILTSLNEKHVQAHYLENDVLLVPGSNSLFDYVLYNLRIFRVGGTRYRVVDSNTERDDRTNMRWHQGFLAHAHVVIKWLEDDPKLKGKKPKFIIGHSLGAASAQLLAMVYDCPTITFAAPRTRTDPHTSSRGDKCLNILRSDDPVCKLPSSFHHIGLNHELQPAPKKLVGRHHMSKYIWLLDNHKPGPTLPPRWPL